MNYALIFAGGVGRRMNSKAMPKQFLEIHGKPIIIYTLEHFENNEKIEAICIVCVKEWIDYLNKLIKKFCISKVKWIIPGGETALDSQYLGLKKIYESKNMDEEIKDIVLLHDGVRPLIDEKLISDCIDSVKKYGSAISVVSAIETVATVDENGNIVSTLDRSKCVMARAPQAFYLKDIFKIHKKSIDENKRDFVDSASMMLYYKMPLHSVYCSTDNIKVTTPADFYICRALLDVKEEAQIYGF